MRLYLALALALLAQTSHAAIAQDNNQTASPSFKTTREGYPAYKRKRLFAEYDLRGKTAPRLTVQKYLNGAPPDARGKVVLVDFWATWCGPCRRLIPELNQFKKKFGDDLVIVGISDEPEERLNQFIKENQIDYLIATDPNKVMKEAVGVHGIPHVLVITPDNIVRWQGYPAMPQDPLNEEKLAKIISVSKSAAGK